MLAGVENLICRTIGNESIIQYQDHVEELPLCTRSDRDIVGVWQSLTQTIQANSRIDQAMNPFRTGKLVLFQVTYNRDWHFFEIMFFVIIGIFGVRPHVSFCFHQTKRLLGTLWCLRDQVQHASCFLPQEAPREAWSRRGRYASHDNCHDRLL
jgi:hypothetical protein